MIYIISPYTASTKSIEQARYEEVLKFTTRRFLAGDMVFSPIVHCHHFTVEDKSHLPFLKYDHHFIDIAEAVYVLKLNGINNSKGCKSDLEHAWRRGKPIVAWESDFQTYANLNQAKLFTPAGE